MNPFFAKEAPFALVIFVASIGWLVSTAFQELRDVLVVEYRIEHVEDGPVKVHVTNRSLFISLLEGDFVFKCIGSSDVSCTLADDTVRPAKYIEPNGAIAIKESIEQDVGGDNPVFRSKVILPASSSQTYVFYVDNAQTIRFNYQVPETINPKARMPIMQEGWTFLGFISNQYIAIIVWLMAGGLVLFIALLLYYRTKPAPAAD